MKTATKFGCAGLMTLAAIFFTVAAIAVYLGSSTSSQTTSLVAETQSADVELTLAQYEALQAGMTADQVAGVLGTPGKESSSSTVDMGAAGSTSSTIRTYSGTGFMTGTITVIFSDGGLMSKSQFNLK